jgi:hypothetical protein
MGEIEMHASGSHTRFDELDPVPERIRDVHALQAGDRHVPLDGMTGIDAADDECREAFHAERRVGLAGGLEIRVDPEMELGCTAAEPETAAVGERGGLGDFLESEHVAIEAAGRGFGTNRYGQLDVIDADYVHGQGISGCSASGARGEGRERSRATVVRCCRA